MDIIPKYDLGHGQKTITLTNATIFPLIKLGQRPKCHHVTVRAVTSLFFVIRPVPNKDSFILCHLTWGEEVHENIMKTHDSIFI